MTLSKSFASDNNSGVHPDILKKLTEVNTGHVIAYGDDKYTVSANEKIKEELGKDSEIFFVFTGTAANVLSISSLIKPYEAVICDEGSHLYTDECGAPERFSGCKLLPVPTPDGKLTVNLIQTRMKGFEFEHHVQPKVISITQSTEVGTVYTPEEIKKIADFAHNHHMYLHVDGARIYNAAASLNVSLKSITADAGVDILSLGGTKNGMMYGEAIVFFDKKLSKNFKYIRKQGMQLGSKMRFIAGQFEALFTHKLWLKNAQQANKMAQLLATELVGIPQIQIVYTVQVNGIFAIVPPYYISVLQQKSFFYVWDDEKSIARWMTSFDTTEEDIHTFVKILKETIGVEDERKCKICGNKNLEIMQYKKQDKNYYYCHNCGFIWLDPSKIPTVDEEKERYLKHNNAEENSGYPEMLEEFIETAVEPHHHPIKTALDFGCGPIPLLAQLLEKKGIKTDTYDPFFAPDKIYENKKYDLITCTEVYEHIFNPLSIMELFKKHLNKNGIIAIMTMFHPNDSEKFLEWWYIHNETHISFYTHRTFEYLAHRFGLHVLLCTRKNICVIGTHEENN